jgi:hypothetical protein
LAEFAARFFGVLWDVVDERSDIVLKPRDEAG